MGRVFSAEDVHNLSKVSIIPETTFGSCKDAILVLDNNITQTKGPAGNYVCGCMNQNNGIYEKSEASLKYEGGKMALDLGVVAAFSLKTEDLPSHVEAKIYQVTHPICSKCQNHRESEAFKKRYPLPPTSNVDPTPINSVYDILASNNSTIINA